MSEIRYPSLDPHDDVPEFYRSAVPTGSGLQVSLRCDPVCPVSPFFGNGCWRRLP